MTKAKPSYKQLEHEIALLKKQLSNYEGHPQPFSDDLKTLSFESIFDIDEIQKLQDAFAEATGVASIITDPLGKPITKPSSFCHLCTDIIGKTEKGRKNCHFLKAILGNQNDKEAIYLPCLGGGLLDGGAIISVKGTPIANWLIGQVVNTDIAPPKIVQRAENIGADAKEFSTALKKVEKMSLEKFKKIADALYLFANELSNKAYQNFQLKNNITEQQNKEKLLLQAKLQAEHSEKRFKALHNASFGGIAIHDKGLILDCNQGLSDISGYPLETLIGMNGLLLIAEQSRDEVLQNVAIGYEQPYEAFGLRQNGSQYPIRIEAKMIPYKGREVRVTEFRDITLQKKIEQNLIEQADRYEILNAKLQTINTKLTRAKEKAETSEEQLKLIANNFVDGMIYQVIALDENNRKFTYVSENVKKLYDCTPEQAKQNSDLIYSKIHKEDIKKLIQKEHEALKSRSAFRTEARVVNPDGSVRWSIFISQPRIIKDLVYWDGFEINITERKKLEQDLIQAKEKAVESDMLKSAFLANMSHEIRTPMNSILGFSQLLKIPDLAAKDHEKYIDLINLGGQRLLTLIGDIVDVSKIDANQLSIKIKACNINELIDNLHHQFTITEHSPEVHIKTQKSLNNEDSIIQTDCVRLTQILSNLMENALKFTKKGDVEFGYTTTAHYLQFFVKDSGIGIDPNYHNLVFDRFRQVNDNYHNTGTGTGLGLSIVKGLVELLGGKIWIESEINKGATFYFTLPI